MEIEFESIEGRSAGYYSALAVLASPSPPENQMSGGGIPVHWFQEARLSSVLASLVGQWGAVPAYNDA